MINKDHLAADVACIIAKARVIECEIRADWQDEMSINLENLLTLAYYIQQVVLKWEEQE